MPPAANVPERAPEGTPLYVHLPFCVVKCTYCDFFSVVADHQDLGRTLDAILVEAERRAPRRPRSVFLGGGTPSLFSAEELGRLLDGLEKASNFRSSSLETTVECNPESLEPDKVRALLEGGVDRLSIGLQSLDPGVLQLFGRPHTVDIGLSAVGIAREAGVPRLSVDLIYAVPGQPLEPWLADLGRVLDLGPDHVSAYHLAYEEGTLLTQRLAQGRLERWDEDTELAFLLATRERLGQRGFGAYEISNFSPSGQECAHNINYWENGPYVGIGPSAVSKVGHTRFGNPRSLVPWLKAVEEAGPIHAWHETLAPAERLGETWWLGLRLARGVCPHAARRRAGFEALRDPALELARVLAGEGWLDEAGGRWRLSERGLPLADALSGRFLRLGVEEESAARTLQAGAR